MIYVIGSGPAGVSCAAALLERGATVTLLDAGVELEENQQTLLDDIQTTWDDDKVSQLKSPLNLRNPVKKIYNSNFVYADVAQHFFIESDKKISFQPSFATGGFSNAWGAFVEQYTDEHFHHWPLTANQLLPYYKKIFAYLSPAHAYDSNQPQKNYYHPSQQAKKIFSHLAQHKNINQDLGFQFAYSQLAVNFSNCRYCGACQHGCPIDLIYSAKQTLRDLQKNPRFNYIKNVIIESISESADKTKLFGLERLTQQKIHFDATRVFIACGPMISSVLALRAANMADRKIRFQDSSHFILPCLMQDRVKNATTDELHTLCQLFLKLNNPSVATHPIHFQLYTYMDHYAQQLKNILGKSYKLFSPFTQRFLDRLVVMQGYLTSAESHQFELSMNESIIKLSAKFNPQVKSILQRLVKHLRKNSTSLGISPIPLMLKNSKIGASFHYGGSLPMRVDPNELETDIFGKLPTLKRIHIVDSAIFPTIPAGSITPTIMANAYRIGMECPL